MSQGCLNGHQKPIQQENLSFLASCASVFCRQTTQHTMRTGILEPCCPLPPQNTHFPPFSLPLDSVFPKDGELASTPTLPRPRNRKYWRQDSRLVVTGHAQLHSVMPSHLPRTGSLPVPTAEGMIYSLFQPSRAPCVTGKAGRPWSNGRSQSVELNSAALDTKQYLFSFWVGAWVSVTLQRETLQNKLIKFQSLHILCHFCTGSALFCRRSCPFTHPLPPQTWPISEAPRSAPCNSQHQHPTFGTSWFIHTFNPHLWKEIWPSLPGAGAGLSGRSRASCTPQIQSPWKAKRLLEEKGGSLSYREIMMILSRRFKNKSEASTSCQNSGDKN